MADKKGEMAKERRAWIRILESGIAVMLMVGFFTIIAMKHISLPDISDEVYQLEREVLKEVSENENVRMAVLTGDAESAYEYIQRRLSPYVSSAIRICDSDEACTFPVAGTANSYPLNLQMPTQNVYTDDYLISTCLSPECAGLPPQLLRLFVWFEEPEDIEGEPVIYLCGNGVLNTEEQCDLSAPEPNLKESKCKALNPSYVLGNLGCTAVDSTDPCVYDENACDKCDAGKVTFVGEPTKTALGEIEFVAKAIDGLEITDKFNIRVYQPDEIYVDGIIRPISIANGENIIIEFSPPEFPSEAGSLITIEYDSDDGKLVCQDWCRINDAGQCVKS